MSQKQKSCHELASTQRVLKWVNKQRAKLGWKPLKKLKPGYRGNTRTCSVAASLNRKGFASYVSGPSMRVTKDDDPWTPVLAGDCPVYVSAWITRFDGGVYPELVID